MVRDRAAEQHAAHVCGNTRTRPFSAIKGSCTRAAHELSCENHSCFSPAYVWTLSYVSGALRVQSTSFHTSLSFKILLSRIFEVEVYNVSTNLLILGVDWKKRMTMCDTLQLTSNSSSWLSSNMVAKNDNTKEKIGSWIVGPGVVVFVSCAMNMKYRTLPWHFVSIQRPNVITRNSTSRKYGEISLLKQDLLTEDNI